MRMMMPIRAPRPRPAMLSFDGGERDDEAAVPRRVPGCRFRESVMVVRLALRIGMIAGAVMIASALAEPQRSWAQTPPVTPARPDTPPNPTEPGDAFGEDTTLTAKPIVFVKGTGTWDNAFETITGAFKRLKTYADKEGLKSDGLAMTIFTSTDDTGFQYQAALPVTEPPKNSPRGDISVGQSPEGRALKFVHRGSYDALDNTYEAITNYLDEKRLEAKDMFIEQYVTDPVSTPQDKLIVNVLVMIK
jgi:effector-binding domain-containing protein